MSRSNTVYLILYILLSCFIIQSLGIIYDFFLFTHSAFRIAPPLTIVDEEITKISKLLISALDEISNEL